MRSLTSRAQIWSRWALRQAEIAAWTAPLAALYRSLPEDGAARAIVQQRWASGVLALAKMPRAVLGALPPARGPRILIANHRSAFDVAVLLAIAPRARVVGAAWATNNKLVGPAVRAGGILVDAQNPLSGVVAMRQMRRHLERGGALAVFPEGVMHADPALLPFRPGVWAAARGLDAEWIPIGLAYPSEAMAHREDALLFTHVMRILVRQQTPVVAAIGPALRSPSIAQAQDAVAAQVRRATEHLPPP